MSNNQGGLTYSVDIVLCIDATASMGPVIENVKSKALQLPDDLVNAMAEKDKAVTQLRLRVIAYRDILHDSESSSIVASEFFTLPDDRAGFDRFIGGFPLRVAVMSRSLDSRHLRWRSTRRGRPMAIVVVMWS
jgi:hypothetical protein